MNRLCKHHAHRRNRRFVRTLMSKLEIGTITTQGPFISDTEVKECDLRAAEAARPPSTRVRRPATSHTSGQVKTVHINKVNTSPTTDTIVCKTDHTMTVCFSCNPKYSRTIQKPASLT